MGLHTVADFDVGAPMLTINIDGLSSEGSARLLVTAQQGGNANPFPVTLRNVRWADDAAAADGQFIRYGSAGTLMLLGNTFGDFWLPSLSVQVDTTGRDGFVAIGNTFRSSAPMASPYSGEKPILEASNILETPTSATRMPGSYDGITKEAFDDLLARVAALEAAS